MEMKVTFNENGGEYLGCLFIECKTFEKIDKQTIKADNVIITIDEEIIDIEREE